MKSVLSQLSLLRMYYFKPSSIRSIFRRSRANFPSLRSFAVPKLKVSNSQDSLIDNISHTMRYREALRKTN